MQLDRARPRFTVRRLMVVVAVVAIVMGVTINLVRLRSYYRWRAINLRVAEQSSRSPSYRDEVRDHKAADHLARLAEKYERAARYPWLPVAPDLE